MPVVKELIRNEENGAISFGDYSLKTKAKLEDHKHGGDLLKVKTYQEITKLEKNGGFLYESVPGTSVLNFQEDSQGVRFFVEGDEDAQITVGLMDETDYEVFVDGESIGIMNTGLGGKVSVSVELAAADQVEVRMIRLAQ